MSQTPNASQLQQQPIAIIGMASLFPQAKNLQSYWDNIVHQVDCITEVPASRWDTQSYFDPDPKATDKTYCKRGGFIPDVDFDPMAYGIPPNLLEVTDISQLLALSVASQALEDAGYGQLNPFDRSNTGVVLGVAAGRQLAVPFGARLQYPIWEKVLKSYGLSDQETQEVVAKIKAAYPEWEENAFPGMLANIVSGRIANRLDLGGVNCTVDAACASSLAAFKIAISELLEGRSNMMLAGGVDVDNSIFAYLCFSKTPALSRKQQVRPFDIDSDGMMLGEGLGMMVLKRLEDAERDGNRVYAVIKGIGTSSDGKYKSIYAPSVSGQVKALKRAYKDAGIAPSSVGLIEAHGTGTMVGDPTEFAALNEVFDAGGQVALGSVKSQIGHTKAAAGTASLIKAALALHHKVLPSTINVTQPNPRLKIEDSAFYLNTETRPWMRSAHPRRAGVSSFGFGGTNYHIVLEEYESEHNAPYRRHRTPQPILLQAATPDQLQRECDRTLKQLCSDAGDRHFADLVETSKSLQITVDASRLGFVAMSRSEAAQKLECAIACLKHQAQDETWEHPTGIFYRRQGLALEGKVVALFSGQGSQYVNMGRELVVNFPELRQTFAAVDELFIQADLEPPSGRVFPAPAFDKGQVQVQAQALQRTEYAQPALGALSVGLYKILQQAGFQPDFVAGHSFGELTALWSAGVLTDQDYFALVKARGQAMAKPAETGADPGTMLAVKGEVDAIQAVVKAFPKVTIANHNSPKQLVLAGTRSDLEPVQATLKEQKFSTVWLPVSAAFHTPLVDYAQKPFAEAVDEIALQAPQRPIYTNVTAAPYPAEIEALRTNLKEHLSHPVQFTEQIENIYKAGGYCFVEFGPRRILTNLVQEILGDRPHLAIALNASRQKDSDHQLREAWIHLRVSGLSLQNLDPYQRAVTLPEVSKKAKRLNVRLNGNNYVSEKTQQSLKAALEEGHSFKLPTSSPVLQAPLAPMSIATTSQHLERTTTLSPTNGHHSPAASLGQSNGDLSNGDLSNGSQQGQTAVLERAGRSRGGPTTNGHSDDSNGSSIRGDRPQPGGNPPATPARNAVADGYRGDDRILDRIEHLLSHFNQHHRQTLETHQQYLSNHLAYTQGFLQLMHQQNALLLDGKAIASQIPSEVIGSLERNMMQFHAHQAETLRTHDQSITQQGEYAKQFFQLAQQQYGQWTVPRDTGPAIAPVEDGSNGHSASIQTVSELIPQSELSLSSAWINQGNPALERSAVPANPLNGGVASPTIAPPEVEASAIVPSAESGSPETKESELLATKILPAVDSEALSQVLLAVVSDKTGYPIDMLGLDMDMEADLGIDSIKRFEILGALMEKYPDFPQPDLEVLAEVEMRTLDQVVEFIQSQGGNTALPTAQRIDSGQHDAELLQNNQVLEAPQEQAFRRPELGPPQSAAAMPLADPQVDIETLSQVLLAVVSDKTGYPIDMLELEMDMEADLGIDSIKRFEILGALMEKYPDFPQPDLEELAEVEMRTLEQVVEFMQSLQGVEKKKHSLTPPAAESPSSILRKPVRLKFLPPPDRMDLTLPDSHVSILTDYGSAIAPPVAQALVDLGWKVVVLSHSHSESLPDGVEQVILEDFSEVHLEQQLTAIATQYGSVGALIHLHPQVSASYDGLYSPVESAILKQVFWMAKHLKIELNQAAQQGRSCFLTVAHLDGAFGTGGQADFSPLSAGLFGLTKSLNWEWNDVFCRAIDLSPELDPSLSVQHIMAELHDPNRRVVEVGYSPQGRVTLTC